MGTAKITPPCPVILVIQEKEGEKSPLSAAVLFVLLQLAGAGPSPAIPSLKRAALLEPEQNYAPSLWRTPLLGNAAQLKILHIRCP